jgi:hypothetical protein
MLDVLPGLMLSAPLSLSLQTNKQFPIAAVAAALEPDEEEEPEREEKHNLVETKKKKTVSRNQTTQNNNNRKLGFWIHRKEKRYDSRCGKLLAKRKKDNDKEQ